MSIEQHYEQQLDTTALLEQVRTHYPEGADLYQLAPLDQLHIGGIKASERLLRHLDPSQPLSVLDIGSGAGGLMRQAALRGIEMIGLDITHQLNRLNQGLNHCLNTPVNTEILTADAHHLPFADNSMDRVLFQHSLLNMPDDTAVLTECRRILKPGGQLIMHEVLEGPHPEKMQYPVPWAETPQQSHLLSQTAFEQRLHDCGFNQVQLEDWSEDALEWRRRQLNKETQGKAVRAPLSPVLILGPRFKAMGQNLVKNLEAGAIRVMEVTASTCF
ncbi:class I SAM-dependent methyltransferase [Marinobacterium sp. AK62]|uniref:Class I SAM-dependent methyltransferase n=1 Tax=Marinobacterium alkalitolerans TaxID=1542925 RepID=A0ABS3ZDC7_9GAMM|nr:class I SAM-dependent methyltransferase [Marinobacterium alkalitolerans]MBP0049689.1 class I SAM-dependent methyltransferase [Marinobacterium alkalitolerans]